MQEAIAERLCRRFEQEAWFNPLAGGKPLDQDEVLPLMAVSEV
jgi:hypothetical protein